MSAPRTPHAPRLYLVDDERASRWAPFAATRPVGELRFGAWLLRERVERATGLACAGYRAGAHLAGWDEPGAPPVLDPAGDTMPDPGEGLVAWNSRAVPGAPLPRLSAAGAPTAYRVDGRVAAVAWPAAPPPDRDWLEAPDGASEIALAGEWLAWPWSLVDRNADRLAADLQNVEPSDLAKGVSVIGEGTVSLHATAVIEPGVTVDTREGPVRLDEHVRVEGPGRLVGPLHLGAGTTVYGGSVGRSSIGPVCKVRGEVDGSVLLGFSNKAHDGYLGHALVGRWVNLGALTTNSDLKNSYSAVRVSLPHGSEDTGLLKVGVFLGDHVKTGIGTLLTTGAVVGAASNLFGGGTPPRVVAPFTWLGPEGPTPYRFEKFVEVARAAMARRGHALTDGVRSVLARTADGAGPDR